MDFKIVDTNGNLVAAPASACEALDLLQVGLDEGVAQILLDDTGVEMSMDELEILCAAERSPSR